MEPGVRRRQQSGHDQFRQTAVFEIEYDRSLTGLENLDVEDTFLSKASSQALRGSDLLTHLNLQATRSRGLHRERPPKPAG